MTESTQPPLLAGIYLFSEERQTGPYTVAQLRTCLHAGLLRADALAWWAGNGEWRPVQEVPGLARSKKGDNVIQNHGGRASRGPRCFWLRFFVSVVLAGAGVLFVPFTTLGELRPLGWAGVGLYVLGAGSAVMAMVESRRLPWRLFASVLGLIVLGLLGFVGWWEREYAMGRFYATMSKMPQQVLPAVPDLQNLPATNTSVYHWIHQTLLDAGRRFEATADKTDVNAYMLARSRAFGAALDPKWAALEHLRRHVVTDVDLDEFIRALPYFIKGMGTDVQVIESQPRSVSENYAIMMRMYRMAGIDQTLAIRYGESTSTFSADVPASEQTAAYKVVFPPYFEITPNSAEEFMARRTMRPDGEVPNSWPLGPPPKF